MEISPLVSSHICTAGCSLTPRPGPKCPVCLDYLLPPVYQCFNGHLICKSCHPRVNSCPVCREIYQGKPIRNLTVEENIRESVFECKHKENGCELIMNYEQLMDHEFDCVYSSHNYCHCLDLECDTKINAGGILEHLKSAHHAQGFESGDSSQVTVNICQKSTPSELDGMDTLMGDPVYIAFDGNVFFLKTLLDARAMTVSWIVGIAGSKKAGAKYEAQIRIINGPNFVRHSLVWSTPVYSFMTTFDSVPALALPLKMISCTEPPTGTTGTRKLKGWKTTIQVVLTPRIPMSEELISTPTNTAKTTNNITSSIGGPNNPNIRFPEKGYSNGGRRIGFIPIGATLTPARPRRRTLRLNRRPPSPYYRLSTREQNEIEEELNAGRPLTPTFPSIVW